MPNEQHKYAYPDGTDPTNWRIADDPLPPEDEMARDDALEAFVSVLNITRPEHAKRGNRYAYPAETSEIEYGVTRSYHARCGPRSTRGNVAYYGTRMTYINSIDRDRHLALLTHEVTHVSCYSGTDHESGGHPPRFWRLMAFHGQRVADAIRDGRLTDRFPGASADGFESALVADPNSLTVDQRYWTVAECKTEVARLIGRPDLAPNDADPIRTADTTPTHRAAGDR